MFEYNRYKRLFVKNLAKCIQERFNSKANYGAIRSVGRGPKRKKKLNIIY